MLYNKWNEAIDIDGFSSECHRTFGAWREVNQAIITIKTEAGPSCETVQLERATRPVIFYFFL